MKVKISQKINTDVLVIGGGAAGLRGAIEARSHDLNVMVASEAPVGFRNNSAISKATFSTSGFGKEPGDSPEVHFQDTLTAGRFINDRKLVTILTQMIPPQIHHLKRYGVNFRLQDGELLVGRVPGHTYPRQVSAQAAKGINLMRPLRQHAASIGIQFIEGILITKLLSVEGRIVGALGINEQGEVTVINAKSTILATGGAGRIYLRTNNAIGATGDGYILAYEAGAVLRDMEFVQFYPTAWGKEGSKMCMYEWFLPMGAILRNALGEDIPKKAGIDNVVLVTRDVLTRTVMKEITGGKGINGNVIFDLTTIPEEIAQKLSHSVLMSVDGKLGKLMVAPTAHFFMGGIKINEKCETGINGLYAAGEVCGGIHGANRLGGNALSETLVFGTIAGSQAAASAAKEKLIPAPDQEVAAEIDRLRELATGTERENLDEIRRTLRQTMWDKVGVIRDKPNLEDACKKTLTLRQRLAVTSLTEQNQLPQVIKLANMLKVAEMVSRAALLRTESRGAHYRADYPEENNQQWRKTIEISCQNEEMKLQALPVAEEIE